MEEWNENRDDLIDLFGKVRDEWLEKDFTGWIGANRLYPGVSDALKFASSRVYIVTTKQPLPSTSTAKGAEARSNTIWKQKNQVLWFPPLPLLNPFYFVTRNYDMGRAVWDEMHHKGCCPDDNSYTVIGGLIRQGRPDEACKYLEEMMERRGATRSFGKFEVSNVLASWADMMKKNVERRGATRSFGPRM